MSRKYRIKEVFRYGNSTFYVQYKFLYFWRTCSYYVKGFDHGHNCKHRFRSLADAKAFLRVEEKEFLKEQTKNKLPKGTKYHEV